MTVHCPDCLYEVPVRKPGKDARCDWCRSQVGHRWRDHYSPPNPLILNRKD